MHHNTLKGFIKGIFIDMLQHDYPWVSDPVKEEGEENWPYLLLEKELTLNAVKQTLILHRDQFLKEKLK
jgi:hypothetical protein